MSHTIFIMMILLALPAAALADGYYAREVKAQRSEWQPFAPGELFEEALGKAFPDGTPEVATTSDYRITINLPARRLFLYERGALMKTYPVAVGTNRYRTPVGPRFLKDVTWNPWWYPPPYSDWAKNEKPTPPGPGNPLGRVKMSLGGDIYLHATNKEYTVGTTASHGCMRMKGKDAVELAWFFQSKVSDQTDEALPAKYEKFRGSSFFVPLAQKIPVEVVYERVSVWERTMEIYPDIYGRVGNLEEQVLSRLSSIGIAPWEVDPMKLEDLKRLPNTTAVPIEDLL
jgi:hypothetical protein